jgi:methyl-accepting chemotaxis protein
VAGASHEQTQGITQINSAVGQMDKVTQSNAANAEESAAAAQELNGQAAAMKESVAALLQLVGGGGQTGVTPAPAPAPRSNPEPSKRRPAPPHKNAPTRAVSTHGPTNGNGHGEIPMDGDFKDF